MRPISPKIPVLNKLLSQKKIEKKIYQLSKSTSKMPSLNKKDYTDHISAFFAKQGKRMTNLSKMSIERLEAIIRKHKIPDLNEDEIFQARIDKRREQSEARKKKKNGEIEGTEEYEEKRKEEEEWKRIAEENERHLLLKKMMGRILRTKYIKMFYDVYSHDERMNQWRSYVNRRTIALWNKYQSNYDLCMDFIKQAEKQEDTSRWNLIHRDEMVYIDCNGINVSVSKLFDDCKIKEPYMRIFKCDDDEINPFK